MEFYMEPININLLTEKDIHEMPARDLDRTIAVYLLEWKNIKERSFANLTILEGVPYKGLYEGAQPLPEYSSEFTRLGEVIKVLTDELRLDLEISRRNGVTSVTLYCPRENIEYVSSHNDHELLPRLICEVALKYLCNISYVTPYEEAKVQEDVLNVSALPSGIDRETMSVPDTC